MTETSLRGPQRTGFAQRVREAITACAPAGEPVTYDQIYTRLDIVANTEKQRVIKTLRDFRLRGEIEKPADRTVVYVRAGAPATASATGAADGKQRMWRVLRARHTVTLDDLEELAQVSRSYAAEFIGLLVRQSVVRMARGPRNQPRKYVLVSDTVQPPAAAMRANGDKLRRIRQQQAEFIAAMTAAELALKKCGEAAANIAAIAHE